MDEKDREIIDILENDGRASYTEIAEKIGVSEGTVRNRVQKLKDQSVIEKFTVEINHSEKIEAFVSINVSTEREFSQILQDFPEDIKAYELAGEIDILVKISAETSSEINEIVDQIRKIQGVKETNTHMVLSS